MSVNWYIGAEDQDVGVYTGALNWALSNFDSLVELLEPSDLDDLITSINNEISARVQSDDVIVDSLTLLNQRINNLLYDPIPSLDTKNGSRKYLNEFVEVLSTDQIDGLEQRLSFFTNALQGKLSGISANSGTGLTIDTTNPAFPNISQNRPFWNNIQGKPSIPANPELQSNKGQANGYPSLDATGQIPVAQLPILQSAIIIVNTITERNLLSPTQNLTVFVRDATLDPTVSVGWATYLYDFDNTTWIKKSEGESLDIVIVQSWDNVTGKPLTFTPSTHSHAITDVTGLQSALNAKRNLVDEIPASEITETTAKRFVTDSEKSTWNSAISGGWEVGDTKYSLRSTMVGRWLKLDGKTIGNELSNATALASQDTLNLFTLLWHEDFLDLKIYTSTGSLTTKGSSALEDFNNNKKINLFDSRGLFTRSSGLSQSATKSNGSYFNGGNRGGIYNDRFQGHIFSINSVAIIGGGSSWLNTGASNSGIVSQTNSAISDGINGTPRTGDETNPAYISQTQWIYY